MLFNEKCINILYLHCHDMGRYIGPFGYAADTPNLMRLAERGVLLRDMHCASPSCSPSRAALLTGMYPHCAGMLGLVNRGFDMEKTENHMALWLSSHGYHTILAGIQHIIKDRSRAGYDVILPDRGLSSLEISENGLAALNTTNGKPFFLDIGLFDTHRPFEDEHFTCNPNYVLPPAALPDTHETRRDMAGYLTEANRFDKAIGYVIEGLAERNLLDNTLILCTTDHGIAFPSMKCNLTVHGIGVFCILSLPGRLPTGTAVDALASQIDLFPTICELAEIPAPPWLQGVSLLPVLRGEVENVRDELFAEVNYHCCYEPQRAVRTSRYTYIRRYTDMDTVYCANSDEGYAKELWLKNGWQNRHVDAEQLYDTLFDPMEAVNRVCDPAYGEILEDLRGRMDRWQNETGDPILNGKITKFTTNTDDGRVFVSENMDLHTCDLWQRIPRPDRYM